MRTAASHEPSAAELACALGGRRSGKSFKARCPAHNDHTPSLDIEDTDGRTVFICRDGCEQNAMLDALKRAGHWPDKINGAEPKFTAAKPKRKFVVARYQYTDADGTLLYEVERWDNKDFVHRRPNGQGGWILNRGDRAVLYRWPDLATYPDATVFVCEGEKDADRVAPLGHCATTLSGGAKWSDEMVAVLAGRDVIVLEDNDKQIG